MKKIYSILIIVCAFTHLNMAQWSTDPLSPNVFCDAPGDQAGLVSLSDGSGGLFCFWLDDRTGSDATQVYGQHFDSDGNILWEPNGKLILDEPGDIRKFKAYHYDDDKLIIVWFNAGAPVQSDNKLKVQELDDNGNKIWPSDMEVSHATNAGDVIVWYFIEFDLVRDDFGFHIGFMHESFGYYYYRLSRFTENGILTTALHGVPYAGNYNTIVRMIDDHNNGVYLYGATGNGSEAPLRCVRLDTLATPQNNNWITWMTVTDAQGLSYSYDAITDEAGITFVWEGGATIKSTRLDTAGVFTWGQTPKILCNAAGGEYDFVFKQNNNDYYVVWKDSRPGIVGNHAMYGQRMDINGQLLWGESGALIADMATFNPFPKFSFDESNNLVVCHAASGGLGLRKHIISETGVQIVGGDGEDALTGSVQPLDGFFDMISLNDHVLLYGLKYIPGDNNIFITCVDGCQITSTTANVSSCFEYEFNGETYDESGTYLIELPGDTVLTLYLTITSPAASATLNGDTLINDLSPGNYLWWNCDSQTLVTDGNYLFIPEETGSYAFIIELNGCTDTTDCFFIDIVGVDNLSLKNEISLFPNPGNDFLTIKSSKTLSNSNVEVYNGMGQLVFSTSLISGGDVSVDTSQFGVGCYEVVVHDGSSRNVSRWIKK